MAQIISIYDKLVINEITYEVGDEEVKATGEIISNGQSKPICWIISHTDLNRIISRIKAMGYEFSVNMMNDFKFDDGTEVIDYAFENVFGAKVALENFEFSQVVKQIRA